MVDGAPGAYVWGMTSPAAVAASTLRAVPFFARLREPDLERLLGAAVNRSYPKGSMIASEGTPEDALYVVLSGRVKIVQISESGHEVILALRGAGDFFGELSLLDDARRTAHAVALEPVSLLVLQRSDFQRLVEEVPGIALGLLRTLCQRVREAERQIGGLVLLDVDARLARVVLDQAEEDNGTEVARAITHHMLAQLIGASRETVSRALARFAQRGWVETHPRRVVIRNRRALEETARITSGGVDRRMADRRRRADAISFAERRSGYDRRTGTDRRRVD